MMWRFIGHWLFVRRIRSLLHWMSIVMTSRSDILSHLTNLGSNVALSIPLSAEDVRSLSPVLGLLKGAKTGRSRTWHGPRAETPLWRRANHLTISLLISERHINRHLLDGNNYSLVLFIIIFTTGNSDYQTSSFEDPQRGIGFHTGPIITASLVSIKKLLRLNSSLSTPQRKT